MEKIDPKISPFHQIKRNPQSYHVVRAPEHFNSREETENICVESSPGWSEKKLLSRITLFCCKGCFPGSSESRTGSFRVFLFRLSVEGLLQRVEDPAQEDLLEQVLQRQKRIRDAEQLEEETQ